ncbi:MAG: tyrosine-type recombinase/integrase [Hyphomonas sp.]
MPKLLTPLSAKAVAGLKHTGSGEKTRHSVGGVQGLFLVTYASGARCWLLRGTLNRRRKEIGLGSALDLSLSEAREKAREFRRQLAEGIDPTFREDEVTQKQIVFDRALDLFFETELAEVKDKERKAWLSTLQTYAVPVIGKLDVENISTLHVADVLKPIWSEKRELAKKIRVRLDKMFVWLKATGYREQDSPAKWVDLKPILNPLGRDKQTAHRPAVAFVDAPSWFERIREKRSLSARALEFLCLTAVRSGDVRFMKWDEVDFDAKVWTILPNREGTKLKTRDHKVPLTEPMLEVLRAVRLEKNGKYVFVGPDDQPMSDNTISKLMRELHAEEIAAGRKGFVDQQTGARAVPHGLRSTFRDWVAECTNYPGELAEIAIAHKQGSETELAYKRLSQVEKRRRMMTDWGNYLAGESHARIANRKSA